MASPSISLIARITSTGEKEMNGKQMQKIGGIGVILGFLIWFGGELVQIQPFNVLGIPILFAGAFFYFKSRKRQK
ncbi:MAG TPA: hypothetical protein DIT97_10470 [Gimesia maris]|uniref:Uncharacterized protein n=1 Tax=Gimesia maris TaxID=122 RepID=A0A3D3R772_9PLAN|nr:hypothetical protein [Gimesia maris]